MAESMRRFSAVPTAEESAYLYEYDHNAVRVTSAEPAPAQSPVYVPQTQPRILPDARPERAPKRRVSLLYVAVLVIGVILFSNIISMHGELTALSIKTHQLKSEIIEMEKEQSALRLELNEVMNQNEIEDYAIHTLGMVKATGESISYLNYQNDTVFELAETAGAPEGFWDTVAAGADGVWQTIWSFIN